VTGLPALGTLLPLIAGASSGAGAATFTVDGTTAGADGVAETATALGVTATAAGGSPLM
jgi:hypothetical protein